ncbi:MAG: metallophosphoesterase family protein [Planctomycetota bacterium]
MKVAKKSYFSRARGWMTALVASALSQLALLLEGTPTPNALNRRPLEVGPETTHYRFLIAGHVRGRGNQDEAPLPAATFLSQIPRLDTLKLNFVVLLGDCFWRTEEPYLANFRAQVLDRVPAPIFNAPGNHDLTDRQRYATEFGATHSWFRVGSELFILLDTEERDYLITGAQLEMLKSACDFATREPGISNVLIFSHKLIWSFANPFYAVMLSHGHGFPPPAQRDYFEREIRPLIEATARTRHVYWFAGDTGSMPGTIPVLCQRDPNADITFIATGLGDLSSDAWIFADIEHGRIGLTLESMTGAELEPLENYDVGYWQRRFNIDPLASNESWAGTITLAVASVVVALGVLHLRGRQRRRAGNGGGNRYRFQDESEVGRRTGVPGL